MRHTTGRKTHGTRSTAALTHLPTIPVYLPLSTRETDNMLQKYSVYFAAPRWMRAILARTMRTRSPTFRSLRSSIMRGSVGPLLTRLQNGEKATSAVRRRSRGDPHHLPRLPPDGSRSSSNICSMTRGRPLPTLTVTSLSGALMKLASCAICEREQIAQTSHSRWRRR